MRTRTHWLRAVMLCSVAWSASFESQASAFTQYVAPLEISADFSVVRRMTSATFQRTTLTYAASLTRLTVKDGQNPDSGDTWITTLEIRFPDGGIIVLGAGTLRYDGGSDCLTFNGSTLTCGVFVPHGSTLVRTFNITTLFDAQCVPLRNAVGQPYEYQLVGELRFGGGVSFGDLGTYPFRPSEFPVGQPDLTLAQTSIHPAIPATSSTPAIAAEQADITIEVLDGIVRPGGGTCGVALADVPLTVASTIVPDTGSHKHFTDPGEHGTGKFIAPGFVFPPQEVNDDGTILTGTTNVAGRLSTVYGAGQFGLTEQILVTATDPNYGGTKSTEEFLDIKVPGLVPMLSDGSQYVLAGTGRPCDTPHNPTPFDPALRQSHYVTQSLFGRLIELTNRYFIGTADENGQNGAMVSFNDASLRFGGVFDDGSGLQPTSAPAPGGNKCHDSHRYGIDVDVNRGGPLVCPDRLKLNCPLDDPAFPRGTDREGLLTRLVERDFDGKQVPERNLHYRFSGVP